MVTSKDIKKQCLDLGACAIIQSANSIADLIALLKSPQGKDFYKEYNYPTVDILRMFKDEIADYGVYVDAGLITLNDQSDILLAGETYAVVSVRATDKPYIIGVMEGAKAIVNSYGYAVCLVENLSGDVEVHQYDNSHITLR